MLKAGVVVVSIIFLIFLSTTSAASGCTYDFDGDGVCDEVDNCRFVSNPSQQDTSNYGIGDACRITSVQVYFQSSVNGSAFQIVAFSNLISSSLAVQANLLQFTTFNFPNNVIGVSVRIAQNGNTDDLVKVNQLVGLIDSNITLPQAGFFPVTFASVRVVENETTTVDCSTPGCSISLSNVNVQLICKRTWQVTNNLPFAIDLKSTVDSVRFINATLAPGASKLLVFGGPPRTMKLLLSVAGSSETLHTSSSFIFSDSKNTSRCLNITPICRSVYLVENQASARITYSWSESGTNATNERSIAPSSSDYFVTFGPSGERLWIDLTDRGVFRRREARVLGLDNSCFLK